MLALLAPQARAGLATNWSFMTPSPVGTDLLAAWAAAPDDLYVGGHGGVIQHWDGAKWTLMSTPTTKTIYALHGTSTRDVWAVGGDGYTTNQTDHSLILHWDGTQWKEMAAPKFSGWTYPLVAVCALGAKDVWATTDIGTFPVHYDGTSWQFVSVPLSLEGSLRAITAVGGSVFFAGTHGQVVRYQNNTWTLEQKTESGNFSANILTTLWGADLQNVYAGGSWGQVYRRNANGTWTELALGAGLFGGPGMVQIWGTSPTDVYIQGITSIRHFNGTTLDRTNDFQYSMRLQWFAGAASGTRLYGVGPKGVVSEFVLDGQGGGTFSPLSTGGDALLSLTPKGAVACGNSGILVYGSSLYQGSASPLSYFDGVNYHDLPSRPPGMQTQSVVSAAWAGSLQDLVVAWDNQQTFERGVHHWNGSAWEPMGDSWNQPADAIAFWRSPAGKLYACGPWRVLQWNGSNNWAQTYAVPEAEMQQTVLSALWGRSDSEIYLGAKNGKILRFNGTVWQTETTPGAGVIQGISGNSTNVFAVGDNGLAWRRNGSVWQRLAGIDPREGDNFTTLVAGADGIYAAQRTPSQYTGGGLGLLWRLSGSTATLVLKGLSQPFDLLAFTGGHLYGLSADGTVLTDQAAPASLAHLRVDLGSTNWVSLGTNGVDLRAPQVGTGRPMVCAWQVNETSTYLSNAIPAALGAAQHWLVRADTLNSGAALPLVYLRFHYDPLRLPAGFSSSQARLFRFDGSAWTAVPATVDTTAKTITSSIPVGLGEWTLGTVPVIQVPALAIARKDAQQVLVSWPVTPNAQLVSAPTLTAAVWSPVTNVPVVSNGTNQALISPTSPAQYFRLKNAP